MVACLSFCIYISFVCLCVCLLACVCFVSLFNTSIHPIYFVHFSGCLENNNGRGSINLKQTSKCDTKANCITIFILPPLKDKNKSWLFVFLLFKFDSGKSSLLFEFSLFLNLYFVF